MKIAIGADHAGYVLKEEIKRELSLRHEIVDVGTDSAESCDYPVYANRVCDLVSRGDVERGILICGTGIGMSIAANRNAGVRTALCHNEFTASRARLHNDAHIIACGSDVVDRDMALRMIDIFMNTSFASNDPGSERHVRRIRLIDAR